MHECSVITFLGVLGRERDREMTVSVTEDQDRISEDWEPEDLESEEL